MEIKVGAAPDSGRPRLIAAPWHTAIVLGVQIALSVRGYLRSHQMREAIGADRIWLYERTIFFQWMVFILVIVGVRLHGSSVYEVLGERWRSLQQVVTDAGIGLLLLLASIMVPTIFGPHSQAGADAATQFLLPRGGAEIAGWIALSVTAGICEEVLFRGYLQKQIAALTNNAATGIVLSAVLFGVAHGYQGLTKAILIGRYGGGPRSGRVWAWEPSPGHARARGPGFIGRSHAARLITQDRGVLESYLQSALCQVGGFGAAGQFPEGSYDDQEGQGDSDHAAEAVEESLGARFAAQGFGGLGVELALKIFDLSLLVGDSPLLIGNLLVITRTHRVLPFLLLALVGRLAVLLDLLVAGVSGKPDQAIGSGYRDWGQGLHGYSLLAADWGLKVTGVQLVGWLVSRESCGL